MDSRFRGNDEEAVNDLFNNLINEISSGPYWRRKSLD